MRLIHLFLFLPLFSSSQLTVTAHVSSLSIGDSIPNLYINNVINYNSTSVNLSLFKNKLLILDFWATWCTSCIKKFPLLDSLQTEYKDKLQVVLVSKKSRIDTRERICGFLEKFKNLAGQHYTFPAIVGDTLIHSLFPHEAIPFYVIIGPDSKVKAFLQWDQLTRENILFYLKQEND